MPDPTKIGVYEVLARIGAGGMGEVYRARDTRLGREVALKILSEAFATDADRLARFQREAQVLASLNHPHIAAIYGLEEGRAGQAGRAGQVGQVGQDGRDSPVIVMELVEGPTLADRIAQGPIPLDEALRIATQIAEALEAAHEAGVIHRDLKPANVKVRPDGNVKVLDFGLAKAIEGAGEPGMAGTDGRSQSPTLTSPAQVTGAGLILGTAAYMAPEQARGRRLDKRADVWAFGVVLYEMLTGKRAFTGDDVADTLAAVIRAEPDWKRLPLTTPPAIRRLLKRSLEKDVRLRLSDMAMVLVELREAGDPGAESAWPGSTVAPAARTLVQRVIAVAAVVATAIATAAIVWRVRTPIEEIRPIIRYSIDLPDKMQLSSPNRTAVAISPDGTHIAYAANERLYLRGLDEVEAKPIPGTETGGLVGYARLPFFSPDGLSIGYWQQNALKIVPVAGGAPSTVCQVGPVPLSASWEPNGEIIFSSPTGVSRVRASGGTPAALLAQRDGEFMSNARIVPGGEWILFVVHATGATPPDQGDVAIQLPSTGERRILVKGARDVRYLPTGYIVFGRGNTLFAQPFDAKRLTVSGTPVPVLEGIATASVSTVAIMHFAVSSTGTIFYVPGTASPGVTARTSLVRVSKDGSRSLLAELSGMAWFPRVSPDGTRVAYGLSNSNGDLNEASDLWVMDLARGARTRATFAANTRFYPIWTRDSTRLTYADGTGPTNQVLWSRADGSGPAEVLLKQDARRYPSSWSPDGHTLAYYIGGISGSLGVSRDIWVLRVDGDKRTEAALIEGPFQDSGAIFSPNGRWVAYVSNKSGQNDVFVRPFTGTGGEVTISVGGGGEPVWGPSGSDLYYRHDRKLWSVKIAKTQTSLTVGPPTKMFDDPYRLDTAGTQGGMANYDVLPGGQAFVMIEEPPSVAQAELETVHLQVILNWFDDLKRRAPIK